MAVKQFTHVTVCAAGLLLAELFPTHSTQATNLPTDSGDDDAPVTSESTREQLPDTHQSGFSEPAQLAQPERFNEIESAVATEPSYTEPVQIASPQPSEAVSSVSRPETVRVRPQAIEVTKVAVDLESPKPAIALKQAVAPTAIARPETLPLPTSSIQSTPATPAVVVKPQPVATTAEISTRTKDLAVSTHANDLELNPSAIAQSAIAQSAPLPTQPAAPIQVAALPPTILPRIGAEFTAGDTVGNPNSFAGFKGFVPLAQTPGRTITFAEAQLLLPTNNGSPGANLVLGHRIYDQKSDRIYGGYIAFDHRNTGNNGFNQLGLGVETLGKVWDVRANAYLPIGNTRQLASETITSSTTFSDPFFQSNFLASTRTVQQQINQQFEAAASGFDLEAGGKITSIGRTGELRGYGGIYYAKAPERDGAVGLRTRLEARLTDTIQAGLVLSTDKTFGTSVAFNVGVTLPTTRPRREQLKEPFLARLGDSVNRNANIAIDQQTESRNTTTQDTQFVTNPATGQPWRFRHANPGIGTGDGTFENPTGTVANALAVAQPDDIVYVQPGTNPGIPAFTIPDRVQVLSTGPVQRIDTLELGNIQLPGSGAGVLPTVQGTVTLGNTTTLSGFAIATATGPGITGNTISNVIVRDNAIANTAAEGILLNNVQGTVTVQDNTIRQAGGEGFSLNNNQGQVNLLLTRNQIENNGGAVVDGDGVNIELRNGATGNFTLTNNAIANNNGIGGIADGVDIKLFDASNGTFNLADNTITGNQLNGVAIDLETNTQGTFNLDRNTISGNQANGLAALLSNDAIGTLNVNSNTIANNQRKGAQLVVSDRANGTINLTNSTITGNQDDGFFLQTSNQARATAQLLNSTITNNTNYGVFTTASGTSQLRLLTDSNTITGNGFTGVSINTNDNANSTAALRSNTITGNTFGDVESFTNAPGATACLQPLNNTIGALLLDDSFGGAIAVETGALPTNTITTSDFTFWSGTAAASGTCGF